jgi:hypothetical protein
MPFVVARYYGWSLSDVRALSDEDYSRALAVMAGLNEAENEAH